ncbi:MAG: ABC transporter ATP-binding protein [Alphaproteobacteria bacterium]
MGNIIIDIQGVDKIFPGNVHAVSQTNIQIEEGEFFALLGPSGCGKTTLLRMISGFEMATRGKIFIDGKDVTYDPPNKRVTNMVFQSYAVFPHMTVGDNVAYGLKIDGVSGADIPKKVLESLELVQLDHLKDRMPDQLSGGQRQRVALARALVKKPKVLLLDEPLSALDAKLREAMQIELVKLQNTVGITFIMVTHDQDEALSMANRIAVMNKGKVLQVATPIELYEYPTNRFVADFIGRMNLFEGRFVSAHANVISVGVDGIGEISLPFENADDYDAGEEIGIAVRPEKALIFKQRPPQGRIAIKAKVEQLAYYGNESHLYLKTEKGLELQVTVPNASRDRDDDLKMGDECWFTWNPSDTLILRE